MARRVRKPSLPSRFKVFNPDERGILQTLLEDHANTVSTISRFRPSKMVDLTKPVEIHAYLAMIEALENECRRAN